MGSMVSQYVIMPSMPRYLARHPNLLVECRIVKQSKDMLAQGVDLLLRGGEPPVSSLVARKIGQVRFGIYASPAYLRRAGEPLHPRDLARHRCLIFHPPWLTTPPTAWGFERGDQRIVAKVNTVLISDEREGVIAAALAGGGIMRAGMFDPSLVASGRLKRILADWTCLESPAVYAMYRRSAKLPLKISSFIEFAADAMAQFDPEGLTMAHGTSEAGRRRN
jgi:DNA-binding transcriptional LysR family regulator